MFGVSWFTYLAVGWDLSWTYKPKHLQMDSMCGMDTRGKVDFLAGSESVLEASLTFMTEAQKLHNVISTMLYTGQRRHKSKQTKGKMVHIQSLSGKYVKITL